MKTYLVGGAVRDALLGEPVSERDWVVVGGTAEELLAEGYRQVGRDFPVFLHPQSGEEYALARTERKSGTGYTGFTCNSDPTVTLEEDLLRRDLTINAMAEAPDGERVDPYGGQRDLEQRLLRHVSPAFSEDPLRVLRVARFAARFAHLGFTIAPETLALMADIAAGGELSTLPAERLWAETDRALATRSPAVFFSALESCGALAALLPELLPLAPALANLERAVAAGYEPPQRFAALLIDRSQAALEALCDRLRPPNQFRELARLSNRWSPGVAGLDSADRALELLEGGDALRRPERFRAFLAVTAAVYPAAREAARRLDAALAAIAAVDSAPLRESGLTGPALGQALRDARRATLESLYGS
jgi:tRNA nucleotidyltransferase (CCA-adding enzyme)